MNYTILRRATSQMALLLDAELIAVLEDMSLIAIASVLVPHSQLVQLLVLRREGKAIDGDGASEVTRKYRGHFSYSLSSSLLSIVCLCCLSYVRINSLN